MEHGFNDLTGEIGGIEFKDGVSVENISRRDADRLGACFKVEDADTGAQCNASDSVSRKLKEESGVVQNTREAHKKRMAENAEVEVTDAPETSENDEQKASDDADAQKDESEQTDPESEVVKKYTEAELTVIADEKGIAGLREIAKPLGVNGTAIAQIIPKILKAQEAK